MTHDDRLPVLVGAGQLRANRERTVEQAREPLALLLEALRSAVPDDVLRDADDVSVVRIASWAYDGLAGRVAQAVGATPRTVVDTNLGGHHAVRLLDAAAQRIWAGESEIAVIAGAEAQASVSLLGKAGIDPVSLGWTATPGGPPAFDLDELGAPAMQAAELLSPTRVYPLYENRLIADLGLTPDEGLAWSAQLYSDLTRVAAQHPVAWDREVRTAEEVANGGRIVCEPYPLTMNAMPHVDQAAAVVVMSLAEARRRGLTEVVYVWGGAGADDATDVLQRRDFGHSESLGLALDGCLDRAGRPHLDLVDVYSCFPVVPKLVGLHLGTPRDAVLSITGGHSSFGGPLNSYSLHALATAFERLKSGGTGLVHANGGYLTYQHAVVLSGAPHPDGYVGCPDPVSVRQQDVPPMVATLARQEVVIETATVEHDRSDQPVQAFVVARTEEGGRLAASTPRGDAQAALELSLTRGTQVGRRIALQAVGASVRVVG